MCRTDCVASGWPETLIKFGLHIQFFFAKKICLVVRASVSVSMFLDDMTNFHVPSDFFLALHNFIYYQRFQGFKVSVLLLVTTAPN